MKFECGLLEEWYWQGKSKLSREKPVLSTTNQIWTDFLRKKVQENSAYYIIFNKSSVEMWQTQNCYWRVVVFGPTMIFARK